MGAERGYRLFVGGEWVEPAKGGYAVVNPTEAVDPPADGLPRDALPGEVERALRAAVDVAAAGAAVDAAGVPVTIRMGLATGEVVLPEPDAEEPIVAGPVVNLAALLADAARPGRILVDEGTYLTVGDRFRFGRPRILDGDERTDATVLARRLLPEGEEETDDAEDDDAGDRRDTGTEPGPALVLVEGGQANGQDAPDEQPDVGEPALALERAGDEHAAGGETEAALAAYVEAVALTRADPSLAADRARQSVKALRLATGEDAASSAAADPAVMEDLVNEGLAAAPDEETRAWLLALRGACAELWAGRDDDPVPLAERLDSTEAARSVAEALGAPELQAFVGRTLDSLYWAAGDYASAIQNARWQLGVADRIDTAAEAAELVVRSAFTLLCIQGRYAEVSELARRAQILARGAGPHARMHATFLTIGAAYYRGRWSELLPELENHLEALREDPESRCPFVRGGTALGALALAQLGDRERAAEVASRVPFDDGSPGMVDGILARYAVAFGDPTSGRQMAVSVLAGADEPEAAIAMIEALASQQEWETLREFVPTARPMADGMAFLEPVCDRAEGLAEAATGNRWRSLESLRASLGAFESLSVPFEAARTREFIAAIALPEEARDLLEHAAATYERLGAVAYAERARRSLSEISGSTRPGEASEEWPQASSGGSQYGF